MWFLVQVLLIKLLYYFTSLVCEMSDEGWEKKNHEKEKEDGSNGIYWALSLCQSLSELFKCSHSFKSYHSFVGCVLVSVPR